MRVIRRHQLVADNNETTKTAPAATSTGRVDPAERPHNPNSFEIFNPETDDLDSDEDSDDGEEDDKSDGEEDCSGSCGGGEAEEESKKSSSATTSSSSPDSNDSVESVVSARTDTTGLNTVSICFCFLFCKESLICLEGKSMTPRR